MAVTGMFISAWACVAALASKCFTLINKENHKRSPSSIEQTKTL
ncbi:MAG: hypothetical protein ACJASY_002429 [Halioglobus sp.]|jgi:hypothetical protein